MEKRFGSLRIIAVVFKILAWITLVGGILGGIAMIIMGIVGGSAIAGQASRDLGMGIGMAGVLGGILSGLGSIIGGVLGFVAFLAYGDAIFLALAIEENTRETAYYLKGGEAWRR
jgi:hypothetical protein